MKCIYIIILLLFCSMAYCQDTPEVEVFGNSLALGEALEFGGRSVKFKELISDSRCPRNVTCIWAGEAKVLVEVFENGQILGTEVLTMPAGENLSVFLQDFFPDKIVSLTALVLSPYPEVPGDIKPQDYTLSLEVAVKLK